MKNKIKTVSLVLLPVVLLSFSIDASAFYAKEETTGRMVGFVEGGDSVRQFENDFETCTSDNAHIGGGRAHLSLRHMVEMTEDKLLMDAGDSVTFRHFHEVPFYVNQTGGAGATPYGAWCDSLSNRCSGGDKWGYLARPGNESPFGPLRATDITFTGKRIGDTDITLRSDNQSVISCSGLICSAVSAGVANITAHVTSPEMRLWAGNWNFDAKSGLTCRGLNRDRSGSLTLSGPPGMVEAGDAEGFPISKTKYLDLFKEEIMRAETLVGAIPEMITAGIDDRRDFERFYNNTSALVAVAELQISGAFTHSRGGGWSEQREGNRLYSWDGNWRPYLIRDEAKLAFDAWLDEGRTRSLSSYLETYLPNDFRLLSAHIDGTNNLRGSFYYPPVDLGPWTITVRAPEVTITATKDIAVRDSLFGKIFSFLSRFLPLSFAGGSITVNDEDNVTLNWNVQNAASCAPVMDPSGTVSNFPEWTTGNPSPFGGSLSGIGPLSGGEVYAFGIACRNTFGIEDYDLARVSVDGEILPPPSCNENNIKDLPTEECDGSDLGGATCPLGFIGTPSCSNCRLVYSGYCSPPDEGGEEPPPGGGGVRTQCNDNRDNEAERDGFVDEVDPACWGPSGGKYGSVCPTLSASELADPANRYNPTSRTGCYNPDTNNENNCGNGICETWTGESVLRCSADCTFEHYIEY